MDFPQKKETQNMLAGPRPLSLFIKPNLLWISSTNVTNFGFPKSIAYVPEENIQNFLKLFDM
jgi:hypothetical protein